MGLFSDVSYAHFLCYHICNVEMACAIVLERQQGSRLENHNRFYKMTLRYNLFLDFKIVHKSLLT